MTADAAEIAQRVSLSESVEWHSWNLHVSSSDQSVQDRIALEVIAPTVRELPHRPWFFIRYWQGGPHLRLRVGNTTEAERTHLEDVLRRRLHSSGQLLAGEQPLDAAQYAAEATRLAVTENGPGATPEPIRPPGLHVGSYDQEPDRYGGAALMPATEQMFHVSSQLAVAALPRVTSEGVRAALALHATTSAAAALGDDSEAAEFFERGYANWQTMLGRDQLEQGPSVEGSRSRTGSSVLDHQHGPFLPWHRGLTELTRAVRELSPTPPGQVLFSHVHMLHNRLGMSLVGEIQTYARLRQRFGPSADARQLDTTGPEVAETIR